MSFKRAAMLAVAGLLSACQAEVARDDGQAVIGVDHHVHVHSPQVLAILPEYCASGGRVSTCPEVFINPPDLSALLTQMDEAGVERAHVMSSAYLAQSPMMRPARADADEIVRATNDYTVELARESHGRLVAFVSVNPLASGAVAEIERWSGQAAAAGLKLHLTNSSVDLRNPEHLEALAKVFAAADRNRMVVTIHMRTRAEDYGARDIQAFMTQVLTQAPNIRVVLAHSGGWGGLDEATWRALEAFAEIRATGQAGSDQLYFELGQVYTADTPQADLDRLVGLMRQIGMNRFLAGSDWPFSGNLNTYLNETFKRLPLTGAESEQVRTNRVMP